VLDISFFFSLNQLIQIQVVLLCYGRNYFEKRLLVRSRLPTVLIISYSESTIDNLHQYND